MVGPWRKSTRSNSQATADCVEARTAGAMFQVRDSKLGDASPLLDLEVGDFEGLLRAARR